MNRQRLLDILKSTREKLWKICDLVNGTPKLGDLQKAHGLAYDGEVRAAVEALEKLPPPFDFYSLYHASGSYPEVKITVKCALQREKEGVSEEIILGEALKSTDAMANRYYNRLVITANKNAGQAITDLGMMECWPNLKGVAQHAIEMGINVLEKEKTEDDKEAKEGGHQPSNKSTATLMLESFRFKKFVLDSGVPELQKILTPEAFAKFFPLEVEDE